MKNLVNWSANKVLIPAARSVGKKLIRLKQKQQRGGRKKEKNKKKNATATGWTIQDGSLQTTTVLWTMESLNKEMMNTQKMSTGYVIVYTNVLWTNVATSLKSPSPETFGFCHCLPHRPSGFPRISC